MGDNKPCSQAAGVRTTGFAPAARTSTSPSAPLATCATATSPGQQITRYITVSPFFILADHCSPVACVECACGYLRLSLARLHLPRAAVACPFRRPCRSLCKPHLTIPRQGVTWAQGRHRRCTLVGALPHMAPQCLTGLQCRAMVSHSSLGVLRIHMDMVVAYQWGAPTGQCKWPGQLHTLVDL